MRARGGYPNPTSLAGSELSMGWVDPWVGSGWVEIFQFSAGWVGSTIANVLKFLKDYVNAFKARLDKILVAPRRRSVKQEDPPADQ